LRSSSAYNPQQLEGSKTTATAKIEQPLLQNASHEVEYRLDEHTQGMKNFLSCSLQWCAFNICLAIALLPINLCNRSQHL
jgi:hypothetical protein